MPRRQVSGSLRDSARMDVHSRTVRAGKRPRCGSVRPCTSIDRGPTGNRAPDRGDPGKREGRGAGRGHGRRPISYSARSPWGSRAGGVRGSPRLHRPRRTVIVAPPSEIGWVREVSPSWRVGALELIDEDRLFEAFGVTRAQTWKPSMRNPRPAQTTPRRRLPRANSAGGTSNSSSSGQGWPCPRFPRPTSYGTPTCFPCGVGACAASPRKPALLSTAPPCFKLQPGKEEWPAVSIRATRELLGIDIEKPVGGVPSSPITCLSIARSAPPCSIRFKLEPGPARGRGNPGLWLFSICPRVIPVSANIWPTLLLP